MEAIYRDYSPRGVRFFYIYKALAHPETNGYVAPITLEERLMHVREAQHKLGSQIPWLCDAMDNAAKHAMGDAPNSEFVIAPDGTVVRRRQWSRPDELRKDLEDLVGPVERPTHPEELALPVLTPPQFAPTGVVPRKELPAGMMPLIVKAKPAAEPYYVKLRAEADPRLLRDGSGTLYLCFYCDPLYHVHWNNLTEPLRFSLRLPGNTSAQPQEGQGPKVESPSDADPREFLIQVQQWNDQPITVAIDYFACNDEAGWCKSEHQEFDIFLKVDPDGGRVRRGPVRNPKAEPNGPRNDAPGLPGPMPGRPRPILSGTLVEVDVAGKRIRCQMPSGEKKWSVANGARIFRDQQQAALENLQPGDMIQLRVERNSQGDLQVTAIRARSKNGP